MNIILLAALINPAVAQSGARQQLDTLSQAHIVIPVQSVQGRARGDGREEAARACGNADFDSHRNECMAVVSRSNYFEISAVRVCSGLDFSSALAGCMGAIADKEYLDAEAESCAKSDFDSRKVECLKTAGRSWRGRRGGGGRRADSQIVRSLRRIQDDIHRGNYVSALAELARLIETVEREERRQEDRERDRDWDRDHDRDRDRR